MTAAHTPGPWNWDSDPVKGDPTGRVRYQVVALGKTIAKTYYSSYEGGSTNAEADTRLISAAPDLLAALERFVEWYGERGPNFWGDVLLPANEQSEHIRNAMLAIAKAKGETP